MEAMMKSLYPRTMVVAMLVGGSVLLPLPAASDDEKGPVASQMVSVPNLYGKSLNEAIRMLSAAGLGRETQLSDRDGELRYVIRQDPAAGAVVPRGSVVKIYGQLASAFNADEKGRVNLPR